MAHDTVAGTVPILNSYSRRCHSSGNSDAHAESSPLKPLSKQQTISVWSLTLRGSPSEWPEEAAYAQGSNLHFQNTHTACNKVKPEPQKTPKRAATSSCSPSHTYMNHQDEPAVGNLGPTSSSSSSSASSLISSVSSSFVSAITTPHATQAQEAAQHRSRDQSQKMQLFDAHVERVNAKTDEELNFLEAALRQGMPRIYQSLSSSMRHISYIKTS
jgi:hypothetical protein